MLMLDNSQTYRELIKLPIDGRILVTLEALETVPMLIKQMHASFSLIRKRFRTDDAVIAFPLVRPEPNPSAVALIRIFWMAHPSDISRSEFLVPPAFSSCLQTANARRGELNAFFLAFSKSPYDALLSRSCRALAKASPSRWRFFSWISTNRHGVSFPWSGADEADPKIVSIWISVGPGPTRRLAE